MVYWRASDINNVARKVLMCKASKIGPGSQSKHVFGNVLDRMSAKVKRKLEDIESTTLRQLSALEEELSAESFKHELKTAGTRTTEEMMDVLRCVEFRKDQRAWCYKCRKDCRVHPEREGKEKLGNPIPYSQSGCFF